MSGDLIETELEICDICGNGVEEYSIINGLVVCESCKENFELEVKEDNSSDVCALCGWPINRPLSKRETQRFIKGVKEWLRKNGKPMASIEKKLELLQGKKLYLCRYDFFHLIKDIIKDESETLAKKFEEEIASKYDFYGGIIS
jgi:hypothetical protein